LPRGAIAGHATDSAAPRNGPSLARLSGVPRSSQALKRGAGAV
jgi:hypothetical protein